MFFYSQMTSMDIFLCKHLCGVVVRETVECCFTFWLVGNFTKNPT